MSLTVVEPAPTRVTTETGKGARDTLDVLAKAEAATCRRGTSIAMYIAPHRDDDQFTVKWARVGHEEPNSNASETRGSTVAGVATWRLAIRRRQEQHRSAST